MKASTTLQRHPFLMWGCLMAAGGLAELLLVANRATWQNPTDALGIGTGFAVTYGLAGVLILSRRPGNQVGRIFLYLTVVTLASQLASEYAIYAYVTTRSALPLRELVAWISQWIFFTAFPVGLSLVFLFFPDGLKEGRKWRAVLVLAVLGSCVLVLAYLFTKGPIAPLDRGVGHYFIAVDNPTGLLSDPNNGVAALAQVLGWLLSGVALILAVVAAVLRLFQSSGERREQLRWVAFVAAPVAPAFAVHFIDLVLFNGAFPDVAGPIYVAIFVVGLPAAMAVAILKYRLYGIDVVISRTLVYLSLAAFITGVYVGVAVGVGTIVGGGDKPNLGLSILATAIVAVGFQPVRERMQRIANRLVYGKRATPYEVLAQFSERVADSYTADDVMPRMARVLAEGTGAQRADVWLRSGGFWREVATWPLDSPVREGVAAHNGDLPALTGDGVLVPVLHQGDLLGALSVAKRTGEVLTPVEKNLLAHLAAQAGLVLKNVRLTTDLEARLVDLRASRQRLVTAQDQERRRLERNLHDGAQQHLVALKVKIGLTSMLIDRDLDRARASLGALSSDADEALETLRDLARGIYPPLLADKGLPAALVSQARKATLLVEVDADGIGRYSQETEAAVYFCCLEALQNIQKYANAGRAVIRLHERHGDLLVEIEDDGAGFDVTTMTKGAGLTNMSDRFDAIGGEIRVESTVGTGTRICGALPVATVTDA